MKLQSTPQAPPRLPQIQTKEQQPPQDYKPFSESWQVDGVDYASTRDLVGAGAQLDGKTATYSFTTEADAAPFTTKEKIANAIGGGAQGALAGVVVGAMGGAVLALMGAVGDIMTMMAFGHPNGASNAIITIPMALGAAVGAGIGGVNSYQNEGKAASHQVTGTLQNTFGPDGKSTLAFYPNGQVDRRVDLQRYQDAPAAPTAALEEQTNPKLNTLKGVLAGGALPFSIFIPIVGLGAGAYAGYKAGEAVDRRTELGRGLGAALGAGLSVASGFAMSTGDPRIIAGLCAASSVVGGAVGDKVFQPDSQPRPDYGNSWWTKDVTQQ